MSHEPKTAPSASGHDAAHTAPPANVHEQIAVRVRAQIVGGEISMGSPVTEKWLTDTFGVSRPTGRLILQTLIGEGYLVREPFHSARVRTYAPGEIEDILEARRVIEVHAARCAVRASAQARMALVRALDEYEEALDTEEAVAIASAHRSLHVALVGMADNDALCRVEGQLTLDCTLMVDVIDFRRADIAKMRDVHRDLVTSFMGQDAEEAVRLTEAHLSMVSDAARDEIA